MIFAPIKDENSDVKKFVPLVEGRYKGKVVDALETTSKSGNPMIKLTLEVESKYGARKLFDYLLPTGKKLRSFCMAVGLEDKYMNGEITDFDCASKRFEAQIVVESSEQYGDQNKIVYYVPLKESSKQKTVDDDVMDAFQDNDLPF